MTVAGSPGLRDRKRLETQGRIEEAAIALVLRDGVEATTVDAISERADISSRTFFNYFDSKDCAILGIGPTELSEDVADELIAAAGEPGADVVALLVRLVMTVMGPARHSAARLRRDRLTIIKQNPQILAQQLGQLHARKSRLTDYAVKLLGSSRRFADDPDRLAHASILLHLCASAVRSAVDEWAAADTSATLDDVEGRAVALVQSTMRKLA